MEPRTRRQEHGYGNREASGDRRLAYCEGPEKQRGQKGNYRCETGILTTPQPVTNDRQSRYAKSCHSEQQLSPDRQADSAK